MLDTTPSQTYALALGVFLLAMSTLLIHPTRLIRWLQKKWYQYEVTFALYMLTPTERFIFNSILFLFLSMVLIATSLYLPAHVSTIAKRAFYYYAGDSETTNYSSAGQTAATVEEAAAQATETVLEAVAGWATGVAAAAVETAGRMREAGAGVVGGGEL